MHTAPRKFISEQAEKKLANFLKEHHKCGQSDYIPEMGLPYREQKSRYKLLAADSKALAYASERNLREWVKMMQQRQDKHGFADLQLPDEDIRLGTNPYKSGYFIFDNSDFVVRLPTDEDDDFFQSNDAIEDQQIIHDHLFSSDEISE
jgi:hypothetical protein